MMNLYKIIANFKKYNDFDEIFHYYEYKIIFLSKNFNIQEYQSDLYFNLWVIVNKLNLEIFNTDLLINRYICKCLKHFCINYYKQKKRESIVICNSEIATNESSKIIQCDFDDSSLIYTDMLTNLMSNKQRTIINLRYLHGFSDKEIATKLNISRQAVYKNRLLALNNLKQYINL